MMTKDDNRYFIERRQLVQHLRREGIRDELVLDAIEKVPRHLFIGEDTRYEAYEDQPLPIEYGQTISQPYIVAQMTSALCRGERLPSVLEVGTGSGYQAAVLSLVADTVYTIERIDALASQASLRFKTLGYNNIQVIYGDGYLGWPEAAPYPAIIVTAAPESIPQVLLKQLEDGGRMIIPVGELGSQQLILIIRQQDRYIRKNLENVRFVPLLPGTR